ncbi:MAG: hypothetical protein RLZ68_1417 [Pseudomonadota bacterium]
MTCAKTWWIKCVPKCSKSRVLRACTVHLRLCLQVQVQVQFPNRLLNMRPVQSLVTPMPPASVVAVVAQVLPKVRQAEPVVVRPARHPDQTRHVQTHCRTRYSLHRSGC